MNHNTPRSEIYRLLSEAYKQPTAQFIAEQLDIVRFLSQSFRELEYDLSPTLYENWPEIASDLSLTTTAYRQSFLFPVKSRIVPVESVYRRWTQDSTANVAFANEKGLLMSDHALHMKTLYDIYGITIPPEYQSMPDHICLELEFAAFLLERQEIKKHQQFIREHLNWLNELAEDAEKQGIPVYYQQVVKLTAQFLVLELRR
jgi:putative dimethyl sulfoxide reductase chaperone